MYEKKTNIEDNSEIYNKSRNDGITKEEYENMSKNEKRQFFKDYYLKYVLIGIGCIIFVAYIIYGMTRPKSSDTFNCAMVNGIYMDPDFTEKVKDSFWDYMIDDIDYTGGRNRERMYFNSYADDFNNEITLDGAYEKQKIDVIIMNEQSFDMYGKNKQLINLQEELSDELFNKVKDRLVYLKNEETGENIPYGIKITEDLLPLYKSTGEKYENTILCIMGNTKRIQTAVEFIKYLTDENINENK